MKGRYVVCSLEEKLLQDAAGRRNGPKETGDIDDFNYFAGKRVSI